MSRFFEFWGEGWVNLDHVRRIRQVTENRKLDRTITIVYMNDGYNFQTEQHIDLDALLTEIVPAAAGEHCFSVYCYDSNGTVQVESRPDSCEITREPIVAWSIPANQKDPMPILLEPNASNVFLLFPVGDGSLRSPYDATYDNWDDARKRILEEAQRQWDAMQPRVTTDVKE
jgi:hypothetical protein